MQGGERGTDLKAEKKKMASFGYPKREEKDKGPTYVKETSFVHQDLLCVGMSMKKHSSWCSKHT